MVPQIVSVKPAARGRARRRCYAGRLITDRLPLNQIYIQVSVVIKVEHRNPRTHDLGLIELTRHPVEMNEVEPDLLCTVGEPLSIGRTG